MPRMGLVAHKAINMEGLTSLPGGFAQTFRFSTDAVPERDRFAVWNEVLRRRFMHLDCELLTDNTSFQSVGVRFPSLGVIAVDCAPMRVTRTQGNSKDGNDSLRLVILRRTGGPALVTQNRRDATVNPGEAFLVSNADRHLVAYPHGQHILSLVLSRTAIGRCCGILISAFVCPIPYQREALALLLAYGDTLVAQPPTTAELCYMAVAHVFDLTALVLGATRDAVHVAKTRGLRAARLNSVKSDIMSNLASDSLSVDKVATRLRISPRYIQMLFHDEETTFSEFVVGQRLARAWRVLADPRLVDRSITSVAFDCGFRDLSYFNRTFRQRFGCTPSDVRLQRAGNNGIE